MDNKFKRLESLNRIRVKKHYNKIAKEGKKRLTTVLSLKAYEEIYKLRDINKSTTGEVIEELLKAKQYLK